MVRSRYNGGVIGKRVTPSYSSAPSVWNVADTVPNILNSTWPGPYIAANPIAWIDASSTASYSGTGTTINDLSGSGATGTLNGTTSFVSNGAGSYWNFATASDSNYISSSLSQNYLDCTIVFYPDLNAGTTLRGLVATSGPTGTDKSMRFNTTNATSWSLPNPGNANDWASSGTTYYLNNTAYTGNMTISSSGWYVLGGYRTNAWGNFAYNLGSSGYSGRNFQGRIAAAIFYSRQLSAAEQKQNYNYFAPRFGLVPAA